MLNDRLYIDGIDAYAEWGVYVVSQGYNELITYPPLKSVESTDWHEADGIDADLSSPKLDTKEAQLKVACNKGYDCICEFVNYLCDGSYHVFDCRSIGRTYTLRLTQAPNLTLDIYNALDFLTLKFANDFPLKNYEYAEPISEIAPSSDYSIDGKLLTDYGVRILQGSFSEIVKTPQVKTNLLRNVSNLSGAIYDNSDVSLKAKDVKVRCLLRANSLPELWRNYDALLYDLIRPDERQLEVERLGQSFPCHYKSATVNSFYPTDKIWLDFTLTLTFTRDFRISDKFILLAAEDGSLIITENGYAIDLTPNAK